MGNQTTKLKSDKNKQEQIYKRNASSLDMLQTETKRHSGAFFLKPFNSAQEAIHTGERSNVPIDTVESTHDINQSSSASLNSTKSPKDDRKKSPAIDPFTLAKLKDSKGSLASRRSSNSADTTKKPKSFIIPKVVVENPSQSIPILQPPRLDTTKITTMQGSQSSEEVLQAELLQMLQSQDLDRFPIWIRTVLEHTSKGSSFLKKLFKEIENTQSIRLSDDRYCSLVANSKENSKKNRYWDILPFDYNRVLLKRSILEDNSDYINASFVHSPLGNPTFITCQGPLPNTVNDFWEMIWENNSAVVVMLTSLIENGRLKCHKYWPTFEENKLVLQGLHGQNFVVTLQSEEYLWYNRIVLRVFELHLSNSKEHYKKRIWHIQYPNWADHRGSDANEILLLLDFINIISYRAQEEYSGNRLSGNYQTLLNELLQDVKFSQIIQGNDKDSTFKEFVTQLSNWNFMLERLLLEQKERCIHQQDFDSSFLLSSKLPSINGFDVNVNNREETPTGLRRVRSASTFTPFYYKHHQSKCMGPPIIHCSAGCGRSGTLVTIYTVLLLSEYVRKHSDDSLILPGPRVGVKKTEDLVMFIVDHLRDQRVSTVQTVEQFVLCYEAVATKLLSIIEQDLIGYPKTK